MAPSPSNTTIILVPGAFHIPEIWEQVAERLRAKGYNVDSVHLAFVGASPPIEDIQPDIDVIRKHIVKAVDSGQRVVIVAHSYGGVPTSDAVHGFDYTSRQAAGLQGGVVHLVYCCSFLIPVGKSLNSAFGGGSTNWCTFSEDGKEITPKNSESIFYNELPDDIAKEWASKLEPLSIGVVFSEVRYAMWQKVPSTYLYCSKDNSLPLPVQEMMVNEWAGGIGVKVRTETLDSGHSPFLSKPDEIAAAIDRAATLEV